MTELQTARQFASRFALPDRIDEIVVHPGGHINDSYLVNCGGKSRFLLQRVNSSVFPRPERIMENIARVTAHVEAKGHAGTFLQLVPATDGAPYVAADNGDLWRTYAFIEGATMLESARTPQDAAQAGRAVGEFLMLVHDLPTPRLHEVIEDFHHTPQRFAALHRALKTNYKDRIAHCREAVDFALSCEPLTTQIVDLLEAEVIPERPVHNDAKMSNVLLDSATGRALCVVDLDTVMPGSTLYDFGDMMRTMLCAAPEDEKDLNRVHADAEMFDALATGFLQAARPILNEVELDLLVDAGILITLETGVRFLTDHLEGDRYFRVHHCGQNLDRARCQFALVRSMEEQRKGFRERVKCLLQETGPLEWC